MGTDLSFSLVYHPQADGHIMVVNRSLGDLLRSLVDEHHSQWDHILPQAKFAYNDSPNRSTIHSPFRIVYGMQPRGVSDLRELEKSEFRSSREEDFAVDMQELHNKIKERLNNSN